MTRWLASTGLLLGTIACGHTETHAVQLRPSNAASSSGRPVEIYMVGQQPAQAFVDMALVQAIGSGTNANVESVVAALRKRAEGMGCDAVVRVTIDRGVTRVHAAGVCVRYTGSPAPAPPAPSGEQI